MSENLYSPNNVPDWLNAVPMELPPQLQVPIGEDEVTISAEHLLSALDIGVNYSVLSFSAPPELAQLMAEATENPHWKNLPAEPTSVTRTAEDAWDISVGEAKVVLNKEGIIGAIGKAIAADAEAQANAKKEN